MREVLPDGTIQYRYYDTGRKYYTPVPDEKRKYRRKKIEGAVRYGDQWFAPLEVLPDEQRVMPETRPSGYQGDQRGRSAQITASSARHAPSSPRRR